MVLSALSTTSDLKEVLAVVDAKSLFDHLSKETVGGSDKRTAIEIQIIRQDLRQLHGEVKWVEHLAMLADGLTKVQGSNEALYRVLSSGMYTIKPELEAMSMREAARQAGQTNSDIRRSGIKEELGSCETRPYRSSEVDPRHAIPFGPNFKGPDSIAADP